MPSESLDVHDFVVNKGHGVRGLSAMGLRKVPNQYVQPLEERLDAAKVINNESIPIIDVSNWDDQNVADSICEAAKKYGFFQLINHEIPEEVLDKVQAAAHRFFEQPTEEKLKYKRDPTAGGTAKLGTSFSPNKEKVMEWKDYLSLQYFAGDGSSDKNAADWPSICKTQALEYLTMVQAIVRKIYDALFKGLNVNGFDKTLLMAWIAVNFNYYPYCPNPELTVGVGRHSDGSALTVLLQDDVGGLFVRAPDGESWIHVPPTRGALVINIGDMIQILSNGIYRSIEHKVVANPRKNRVSVAIFVNPSADQVVGPLPEVLENTGEKPLYREIVFLEYFRYFFSKGHDGKATIEWTKI
ncbi:Bi-functional coumaroyl CoA and feruloyl CoA ortho-hydroxylase F6H2-2-1-like protein [Drosera capensis]